MKRILFVDDEVAILDGLKRMLRTQRHEWEMAFALGAEAALSMMEAATFDVLVTDMRMPGMDGAALLEIVREKYPSMLRIILSGYTELHASMRAVPVAHQFLLKPCDLDVLRSGIERATSLGEILDSKMISSLVGSLRDLPSLPRTYLELRQALSRANTTIDQMVQIVEKDVAVAAKILQLVNSAFFGLARDVTDLKTAVNCLGMNTIHDLVLTVEVFRSFKSNGCVKESFLRDFHEHSRLAARIAIGITPSKPALPSAAVAALLHDVGKLVLAERTPDHFGRALEQSEEEKAPLFEVEEKLTRISHAEVGAYLLSLWGLPHPVVETVAHHHHPERMMHTGLDLPLTVYVSNLLSHEVRERLKDDSAYPFQPIDTALLEKIGVAEKLPEWRKLAEEAAAEIRDTAYV